MAVFTTAYLDLQTAELTGAATEHRDRTTSGRRGSHAERHLAVAPVAMMLGLKLAIAGWFNPLPTSTPTTRNSSTCKSTGGPSPRLLRPRSNAPYT